MGIEAALSFISVTNSCRFGDTFVEIQALVQQICLILWFFHALRDYLPPQTYTHSLLQHGDIV